MSVRHGPNVIQNQGLVDETTNAQIDTLILDNRKKLNEIIGTRLNSFVRTLYLTPFRFDPASVCSQSR